MRTTNIWRSGLLVMAVAVLAAVVLFRGGEADAAPPSPQELRQAESYAASVGVSVDEAVDRIRLQLELGDLEPGFRAATPRFAGLWLQHEPDFRVIVQFSGRGNGAIPPIPQNAAVPIEFRTVEFSMAELEGAQAAVSEVLDRAGIPHESQITVMANQVDLFLTNEEALDDLLSELGTRLPDSVVIVVVEELSQTDADIYGGLELSKCTSGFAVEDSYGKRGITTAAHCEGSISYSGTTLTSKSGILGGSHDVRWLETPAFVDVAQFLEVQTSTIQDVTGTKHRDNQLINTYVCKQGEESDYTCGWIISKSFDPGANFAATFIAVDNDGSGNWSEGGDSGGPVFVGGTAYGTVRGHNETTGDGRYMAINYVSSGGLGLTVLTQ